MKKNDDEEQKIDSFREILSDSSYVLFLVEQVFLQKAAFLISAAKMACTTKPGRDFQNTGRNMTYEHRYFTVP